MEPFAAAKFHVEPQSREKSHGLQKHGGAFAEDAKITPCRWVGEATAVFVCTVDEEATSPSAVGCRDVWNENVGQQQGKTWVVVGDLWLLSSDDRLCCLVVGDGLGWIGMDQCGCAVAPP